MAARLRKTSHAETRNHKGGSNVAKEAIDLIIREAAPDNAESLLKHIRKTALETEFLTVGKEEAEISIEEERKQLARLQSSNNHLLLVALHGTEVIATASVSTSTSPKLNHIGEVGVAVSKEYWGLGIGTMLLEEVLYWSEQSSAIKRLELTVQKRNEKAIHLYEKLGFQLEAVMARGVRDGDRYLDVCLMSKMIG